MKVIIKETLSHDGVRYKPDPKAQEITLSATQLSHLVKLGVIAVAQPRKKDKEPTDAARVTDRKDKEPTDAAMRTASQAGRSQKKKGNK